MKNKFALLNIVKEHKMKAEQDKCKKHPRYKAIRRPLVDCKKCCEIYERKQKERKLEKVLEQ